MNSQQTLLIRATLKLYSDSAAGATRAFIKGWAVIIGAIAAFIAAQRLSAAVMPLGLSGRFIAGLVNVALLSYYYSWIARLVDKEQIKLQTLHHFDQQLFFQIIGVSFILFLIEFVLGRFAVGSQGALLVSCAHLALVILLNAIPEMIYVHRYEGLGAMERSLSFIKENWPEWFIPLVVVLLPCILVSPSLILLIFAATDVMLPVGFIPNGFLLTLPSWGIFPDYLSFFISFVLGVAIAHWFMLFRGFLFKGLEGGTRRRRVFQVKGNGVS